MLVRAARHILAAPRCVRAPCFDSVWQTTYRSSVIRKLHRSSSTGEKQSPSFAFAFDIDGVLLRSAAPIPGASESIAYLQQQQIPFILLTNGGGKHESDRVSNISTSLSLSEPLTTRNFIQSHTPFTDLLERFPTQTKNFIPGLSADSTVLIIGGEADRCRLVAESYGFNNAITPADILAAHPEIWPFSHVFNAYYSTFARPIPRPINPTSPSSSLKVDAILVFHDPRDWALDIQLILDILLSDSGILGTTSAKNGDQTLPNRGYQQHDQPPLYFSNPDLLWAAEYHLPRLGQGGFQHALEGVWRDLTHGAELKSTVIGKPSSLTYAFAEKKLQAYRRHLVLQTGEKDGEQKKEKKKDNLPALKKVYMVGDNPESDIRGANNYKSGHGTEWIGVLVRTGVFTETDAARYDFEARPELAPKLIVDDVKMAVDWALKDSGWHGQVP